MATASAKAMPRIMLVWMVRRGIGVAAHRLHRAARNDADAGASADRADHGQTSAQ